jgi:hypothetical protein
MLCILSYWTCTPSIQIGVAFLSYICHIRGFLFVDGDELDSFVVMYVLSLSFLFENDS